MLLRVNTKEGVSMLDYEAPAEGRAANRGWTATRDEHIDAVEPAGRNDPWNGLHTHLSLNPGTPQKSHGDRPETP